MGAHIVEGEFQSDKYPACPRGKVPLSTKDRTAQDLLWQYAQRRRAVDAEFSDDLEACLRSHGYEPPTAATSVSAEQMRSVVCAEIMRHCDKWRHMGLPVESAANTIADRVVSQLLDAMGQDGG